ncbi:MAG: SDR family oxidoreductase [Pseudomonadota bacterium]|nr:SDR family oxidoreductase [Pseudomonadota bacterium]MEE3101909.1 SDR family oxidoreductase [Pseudomonadota bacterium]
MDTSNQFSGRVAIVMGGGSSHPAGGFSNGQAAAICYARHGARVVAVDRSLDAAAATVRIIADEGGRAEAAEADVRSSDAIGRMVGDVMARHGRIDILHNNVGVEADGDVVTTSEEDWDRVHDINLKGVFLACKHVVPIMAAAGGGAITNISSTASLRWGPAEYVAYNSSKAALNHFSRIMARQHAAERVRVNVIAPGMMDTPHIRTLYAHMTQEELAAKLAERDARCPMGRQGTCWDVANAAVFLASDAASYVSGVVLPVDGALSV